MEEGVEHNKDSIKYTRERSFVKIKKLGEQLNIILPNLRDILDIATEYPLPENVPPTEGRSCSEFTDTQAMVILADSERVSKPEGTVVLDNALIEIKIEKTLDETTLSNLLRLLGQYSFDSLSQNESQLIRDLIRDEPKIKAIKHKKTGVRIVLNMPKETFVPLYELPPAFDFFTGRENELKELEADLKGLQLNASQENSVCDVYKTAQISGPGGVGKSVFVNHFARWQFRKKYYQWVVWLSVGDDEKNAEGHLLAQFVKLGVALGLDPKELEPRALLGLIYERLASKGKGLIVIDDASNFGSLKPFLPMAFDQSQVEVLITTRNDLSFGPSISKVTLDIFTLEDAKNYIRHILKEFVSDDEATRLAKTLGCYPLALTQALAYIIDSGCSISDYCRLYNSKQEDRKELLDTPPYGEDPYIKRNYQQEMTLWIVMQLSLDRVKALCKTQTAFEQSMLMLKCASCLAPENPIPKELMACLLPDSTSDVLITKTLKILRTFSLVENHQTKETYRMHKAIQDVIKIIEAPLDEYLNQIADVLGKLYVKEDSPLVDEERGKNLLPHFHAILSQLEALEKNQECSEHQVAVLRFYLGCIYLKSCNDKNAQQYFQNALKTFESENDGLMISLSLMNLGRISCAIGNPVEAKQRLKQALAILESLYGQDHPDVAKVLNSLGHAARDLGDWEEAKSFHEVSLAIFESFYGPEDIGLCDTLSSLGCIKREMGDASEAKKILKRALSLSEAFYGSKHPNTAIIMMNLGNAYRELGRWAKAQTLLENAVPLLEVAYGLDHRDIAFALVNLGSVNRALSNADKAKTLLIRAVTILEGCFGPNHSKLSPALANLGNVCLDLGQAAEAKTLIERALVIDMKFHGEEHVKVAKDIVQLGSTMAALGKIEAAKNHFERALTIQERCLDLNHPDVAKTLDNLGMVINDLGDPRTAKTFLKRSLAIKEEFFGEKHPEVATTLLNLSCVLVALGKQKKTKLILDRALEIDEFHFGPNHPRVAEILANLANVIRELGSASKAQELLKRVLTIQTNYYGSEHPKVANTLGSLGNAAFAQGNAEEAKIYLSQALDIEESYYGSEHPQVANSLVNLGNAVHRLGDTKRAKELLERALAIEMKRYGLDHPTTTITLFNLAKILQKLGDREMALEYYVHCDKVFSDHFGDKHAYTIKARNCRAVLERKSTASFFAPQSIPLADCSTESAPSRSETPEMTENCCPVSDEETGQTELHLAVMREDLPCIQDLMMAGADPFQEDSHGQTPLSLAAILNESIYIKMLEYSEQNVQFNI